ncbi:hypothetical protein OIU79_020674 [Salix purpurea]|uniref:Uncharacterized protein n=1 Tax=Salix purpurea TaxID=77065 RepID=A0A9Q0WM71_SALPP|nr:hypothetical protein OIU79_020674 [Salix purpurea]
MATQGEGSDWKHWEDNAMDEDGTSLQIEATLSSRHSPLLKTMKELTANSSKDELGPVSLTNMMTAKGVAGNHDKEISISVSLSFTHIPNIMTLIYSHPKHYITP